MQKQKSLFIRASSSSIPYLHRRSGEIPERERVSKAQRFYRGLGAVGEVMAVASADWLGKGRGLSRLAGEGSWPQPIGWGRVGVLVRRSPGVF